MTSGSVTSAALLAATLAVWLPAPVAAQVSGAISVESDYRLRGYSVSGERPAASVRVGYDDGNGIYADGSVSVVASRYDGPRVLGYQLDAGIAKQVGALWTIDLGVARDDLDPGYPGGFAYRHTEIYVGARRGAVSAYVFASPSYGPGGSASLYGQLEATIAPATAWRLSAHVGALELLDSSPRYDWRVGVARKIGDLELHAAVSGGGPGRDGYAAARAQTRITAGASFGF